MAERAHSTAWTNEAQAILAAVAMALVSAVAPACSPFCGLAGGDVKLHLRLHSSGGSLPTDLAVSVTSDGGTTTIRAPELKIPPTGPNAPFVACFYFLPDGGTSLDGGKPSPTDTLECQVSAFDNDQFHVEAAGFRPIDFIAHKAGTCGADDVTAEYTLER